MLQIRARAHPFRVMTEGVNLQMLDLDVQRASVQVRPAMPCRDESIIERRYR